MKSHVILVMKREHLYDCLNKNKRVLMQILIYIYFLIFNEYFLLNHIEISIRYCDLHNCSLNIKYYPSTSAYYTIYIRVYTYES